MVFLPDVVRTGDQNQVPFPEVSHLEMLPGHYPEDFKKRLESQSVFLELNLLNRIESTVSSHFQTLLEEIDRLLIEDGVRP